MATWLIGGGCTLYAQQLRGPLLPSATFWDDPPRLMMLDYPDIYSTFDDPAYRFDASFTSVPLGTSETQVFRLVNRTSRPFPGLSVVFEGGQSGRFVLDTSGMATTLAPGETTSFRLSYRPTMIEVNRIELQITCADEEVYPAVGSITGLPIHRLTAWRETYFGSSANDGDGADEADPDRDGVINRLEFALNLDPRKPSKPSTILQTSELNGMIEFIYTRSRGALSDGQKFVVEWSDSLAPLSWRQDEVTESILSQTAAAETIKAVLPKGLSGARFVRLRVER